ncbi:DDE_3 domain-containing protein [Trichonephila clavipes]|nr:DDE_3 domain-containing protein [Trichonephila clavipes]
MRYRGEIFDRYIPPYTTTIGNECILIGDNACNHRAELVEDYLQDHSLERMEWSAQSPQMDPSEHIRGYFRRHLVLLQSLKNWNKAVT